MMWLSGFFVGICVAMIYHSWRMSKVYKVLQDTRDTIVSANIVLKLFNEMTNANKKSGNVVPFRGKL